MSDHDLDAVLALFASSDLADRQFEEVYKKIGERYQISDVCREKAILKAEVLDTHQFNIVEVPSEAVSLADYLQYLTNHIIPQSVNTYSPRFIGHMTGPVPSFMAHLSRVVATLNQNVVKQETAPVLTRLENQVVGIVHRLIYNLKEDYYARYVQDNLVNLGVFCSGGSLANLTAMAVARNKLLNKLALKTDASDNDSLLGKLVILGSQQAHYSFYKSADLLGMSKKNFIAIPSSSKGIDVSQARNIAAGLIADGFHIMALVGVAGTTESGVVDPLDDLADLAMNLGCHFHVDAAWGGVVLFSDKYKGLLQGIERADSVTIDAHKQFYVPMGAATVVFKDEIALSNIAHYANYSIRKGSGDLGSHSLEGSRPAMALLMHAGFSLLGKQGYNALITESIGKTQRFAELLRQTEDFEVVGEPVMNILNYRFCPAKTRLELQQYMGDELDRLQCELDRLNCKINETQIEAGYSFVSRTTVRSDKYDRDLLVFRVVVMNPWTDSLIFESILNEQRTYAMDCLNSDTYTRLDKWRMEVDL